MPRQINIHTDMWRKIHDFINTIRERSLPVRPESPVEFENSKIRNRRHGGSDSSSQATRL